MKLGYISSAPLLLLAAIGCAAVPSKQARQVNNPSLSNQPVAAQSSVGPSSVVPSSAVAPSVVPSAVPSSVVAFPMVSSSVVPSSAVSVVSSASPVSSVQITQNSFNANSVGSSIKSFVSSSSSTASSVFSTTITTTKTAVSVSSTTKTSSTASATSQPSQVSRSADGFPVPDPSYNLTAAGPVTILMLNSQSTSPQGRFFVDKAARLTSTTVNNNNKLRIDVKSFPENTGYEEYLRQVREACDKKMGGLFDVVMLEATVLGELGDCLVDLGAWDPAMGTGFAKGVLQNSYVNKRLVSLPIEADIGILYFNAEVLGKYASENPPYSFDDIETIAGTILTAQRGVDNYAFSGYTSQLSGEDLTAQVAEWLLGYNRSQIVNSTTGLISLETNAVAQVLQRVSTWTTNNLIDPNDFLFTPTEPYSTAVTRGRKHPDSALSDVDPPLARFVAGNSLFMRHWASTYSWLLGNEDVRFGWGVGPVVGWDHSVNVGALGGWGVGVYKYSQNPTAAVKVAKWMASREMQYDAVVSAKLRVAPTRSDLYTDKKVCNVLGEDLCAIYANVTPAIRPSSLVGRHYKNVTHLISSGMNEFFTTPETIVEALTKLTIELARELGQAVNNNTDWSVDPPAVGKKVPSHLQIQLMGLCAVILITCTTVYLLKRRQIDNGIQAAKDKLAVIAQTAKQEVINKTVQRRADLDFGANEFTHLDDDDEDDDLERNDKNGGRPQYSIVKGAEKDEFI
ncbi:hypothetical protein HDU81_000390 [Chytriomyces hyalinus]|nr:hypothetical protein HDU81_000390 [Chytriomyces hyalinus]